MSCSDCTLERLARHSIGSVPYLNVRPLVHALPDNIKYLEPVPLARDFAAGKFDIALLPVAASFESPGCRIVDGPAIASDGPVRSVILVLEKPLQQARTIALDSASKTSANLVKVLCERHWGIFPAYVPEGVPADAELWIGDRALKIQGGNSRREILDLGAAWKEFTGLPFIYAAWVIAPHSEIAPDEIELFRRKSLEGLEARGRIAGNPVELDYLTNCIRYKMDSSYKLGMARFAEELRNLGLLPAGAPGLPSFI
ncbi:MAG: menaquinone biosynthesis protein [Methylacidiphilales bacterium]|nr:menaquinone biosynthesis protein [Candidatus Methylacidiphilales bacterium]